MRENSSRAGTATIGNCGHITAPIATGTTYEGKGTGCDCFQVFKPPLLVITHSSSYSHIGLGTCLEVVDTLIEV